MKAYSPIHHAHAINKIRPMVRVVEAEMRAYGQARPSTMRRLAKIHAKVARHEARAKAHGIYDIMG